MRISFDWNDCTYEADLSGGTDLSISLDHRKVGVNCFYAPPFQAEPVKTEDFIGDVSKGGAVNFYTFRLNPHGNGTHTESVGHISADQYSVNKALRSYHFVARLYTVYPETHDNGDRIINQKCLQYIENDPIAEALIIRTQPNPEEKKNRQYSGTNPPYLSPEAVDYINSLHFKHLLIDLPSVDREEDDGKLTAHKRYWNALGVRQLEKTITELIFVPDSLVDGIYLLNLQVASIELDASPSRPVLFKMHKIE